MTWLISFLSILLVSSGASTETVSSRYEPEVNSTSLSISRPGFLMGHPLSGISKFTLGLESRAPADPIVSEEEPLFMQDSLEGMPNQWFVGLKSGDFTQLTLNHLHPSQGKIGRAAIEHRIHELLEHMNHLSGPKLKKYLKKHQRSLRRLGLPCTIMPDQLCWISDGHHRASTYAWVELLKEMRGKFSIQVEVVDNFVDLTWAEAISKMRDKNRIYLDPFGNDRLSELLAGEAGQQQEEKIVHLLSELIPSQFTEIIDSPIRASVGECLKPILRGIPTAPYIEFFVGEVIEKRLKEYFASIEKYCLPCDRECFEGSCSKLHDKINRVILRLILTDSEVQSILLRYVNHGNCFGLVCEELVQARLQKYTRRSKTVKKRNF